MKNLFKTMLILMLLMFTVSVSAQTTETFNGETVGGTTFTEGGATFNATGYFKVVNRTGFGFDDNYFMENIDDPIPAGGVVGSFTNSSNFYANDMYITPVRDDNYVVSTNNNLVFRGKLGGATQFTHTLYYNEINNSSVNNYYTYVNLSSYSSIAIDEIEFEIEPYGTNDTKYFMIDNFQFTMVPSSSPPTVTTNAATGTGTTGTTLNGIVNANDESTTVTFEYGFDTDYGTTVTADQSPVTGSTDTPVSKSITGLGNGITYHYRVVGVSVGGTTNGFDKTFTTIPGIPINVYISNDGSEVTVSWNAVTGATSYKVYSSTDPYTGFMEVGNGSYNVTSWTGSNSETKLFYYVVAVN
ncbi:MAG: hypothetical protein PF638_06250 [Candidatus Delongbacteria bacterium]|jgi:hypothetical protein|nr:hypothetical protein [Candidatus Delongbacteria bacterium]